MKDENEYLQEFEDKLNELDNSIYNQIEILKLKFPDLKIKTFDVYNNNFVWSKCCT